MEEIEEFFGPLVLAFSGLVSWGVMQYRLPPGAAVVVFFLGCLLYAAFPLLEFGIAWANSSPGAGGTDASGSTSPQPSGSSSHHVSGLFPSLLVMDKVLSGPLIWGGYVGASVWLPAWQWIAIVWGAADLTALLVGWSVCGVRSRLIARQAA